MARRVVDEEGWDDDDEDWAGDVDEPPEEDEESTIPCPYCKHPIHEDSPRCPHCERYVSEEDAPPVRRPWWIIAGVLLCLYAVYRWVVG